LDKPLLSNNNCFLNNDFKGLALFNYDVNDFNFAGSRVLNTEFRFNNYINLRSSVRNSIVSYNAIQKVFRARFDEGRSNTKLSDFSNFYSKHPYITSTRVPYENLLGKNKENFFKINFYKNSFFKSFNGNYDLISSLNFYFYDFPFLLAFKSDASRYLWFD
jgi:hypothetical protein